MLPASTSTRTCSAASRPAKLASSICGPEEYGQILDERRSVERERQAVEKDRASVLESAIEVRDGQQALRADRKSLAAQADALGRARADMVADLSARIDRFERQAVEVLRTVGKP